MARDNEAQEGVPPGAAPWWDVLRAIREARGLTQEVWAGLLGYSRSTVRRWEAGIAAPDDAAEKAIIDNCADRGVFHAYERGPLTGLSLSREFLHEILADARLDISGAHRRPSSSATLGSELPPRPRTNLPLPMTSFIGRWQEMTSVQRLLQKTRLLTLTGPGGVGKTRLSIEVARLLVDDYSDGIWLVELAPLTEVALVPQRFAAAVGFQEQPGRPLVTALLEHLASRRLLLLVDNCEHLIDACARLVADTLRVCPRVTVLTTSREALSVTGETVYRLGPLALSSNASQRETDAERLFFDRAESVHPDFAQTERTAIAVRQICTRLDGVPLAIELAAARVSVLTPEQIAGRLDDRFRLLSAGDRTALPRHQTLRALIDWSHDLLGVSERTLLRRLSIFSGGWALEAAEAVCIDAELEPALILSTLADLVKKSLVVAEEVGGAVRYRLLESVRQYAEEALRRTAEAEALQARHAEWCLDLAEQGSVALWGRDQADWLRRLELETDNFRFALRWCRDGGDALTGLRLAVALGRFWERGGHLREGREWLERILALATDAPEELRVKALEFQGRLARLQADYAAARPLLEESLLRYRELGDRSSMAAVLTNLGSVALRQGDYQAAREAQEESLSLYRALGDEHGVAAALMNLGNVARRLGDLDRAIQLRREALAHYQAVGDPQGIALALLNLGIALGDSGDHIRALSLLEESHARARQINDWYVLSRALVFLAGVELSREQVGRAVALYTESIELCHDRSDGDGVAYCLEGLAATSARQADCRRAATLIGAAKALRERIGAPLATVDREIGDKATAATRSFLGEDEFIALSQLGQTWTLAQMVDCAVRTNPNRHSHASARMEMTDR